MANADPTIPKIMQFPISRNENSVEIKGWVGDIVAHLQLHQLDSPYAR